MIKIIQADSTHPDFIALVKELDADLAKRDGEEHAFYNQFNKIVNIPFVVIAYNGDIACGCGAIKQFEPGVMEVKRMYVLPEYRGQGIAGKVLEALERLTKELGNKKCILETGKKQPEAIQLYQKNGYMVIESYGQYKNVENSICFEKVLEDK